MALPKYEQIAAELRGQIVRGKLAAGDPLPSVPEISDHWTVAKATAERAIGVLKVEGLVDTRQDRGTVVRSRTLLARTAGERYRTARETGFAYTAGEHADILAAEEVHAPEDVASALGIAPGDRVARRHRLRFDDDRPRSMSCSWFPVGILVHCPRLLVLERIREGTTRYIELQTGRKPHTGRDTWTARLATAEERELLRLEEPAAVAEIRHITFDATGEPLTYEVGVKPGGGWTRTEEYAM
ncbi:GntR family transcriptional regulator [Streptomyces sp. NBC_01803]|uniref:GntR family transcriptional regulator n=1 Tax=Streptomyces sp. NBC_01803 TaxID=2975946 RepID=UPI002DD85235|nr:GntR family transcriptional regulator [Streptomyces sp. NBC_01803]WSA44352.1 GntR family transcriptional regulator [Streptomyces sp. NBC_01803]